MCPTGSQGPRNEEPDPACHFKPILTFLFDLYGRLQRKPFAVFNWVQGWRSCKSSDTKSYCIILTRLPSEPCTLLSHTKKELLLALSHRWNNKLLLAPSQRWKTKLLLALSQRGNNQHLLAPSQRWKTKLLLAPSHRWNNKHLLALSQRWKTKHLLALSLRWKTKLLLALSLEVLQDVAVCLSHRKCVRWRQVDKRRDACYVVIPFCLDPFSLCFLPSSMACCISV